MSLRTSAAKSSQSKPFLINPELRAQLSVVRDIPGGSEHHPYTRHLSLTELSERLEGLARQEIVCVVSISHTAFERWQRGTIQRIKHNEGRFEVWGDNFAIYLREDNIGAILLVNDALDEEAGPAVELYSRAGNLLARIQGQPGPEESHPWRNIMAGRSLQIAGP